MDLGRLVPWTWRRYLLALALVVLAAALRVWPLGMMGTKVAWLTFYPVVTVAALYGGLPAGLLATAGACLVVAFGGELLVGQTFVAVSADWVGLAVFVINGAMISGVAEAMRRANARAKKAQEEAEAANKAKSAFLASMSHELRTPLNAILGFSGILRDDPLMAEEPRQTLEIINRSGEHLLTLINDVLDMAKVEAGGLAAENDAFDLGQMVLDVLDMMRVRADEKDLQLLLDCSSGFPRAVRGDAAKLRQVLINLVGNAVKYTNEGGVTVRLHAGFPEDPDRPILTIEVEDTGVGLAEADQERVFEPFVQVDSGTLQKGTGLGLAITREYVELMGGTITVKSRLGQGSLFQVELPVEAASLADLVAIEPSRGRVIGLPPGQSVPRILIVEDQIENWLLLKRLLQQAGVDARVAENGRQGVDQFEAWRPDLIFMDIRMPVMDGVEATELIRASEGGSDVKIVALTASVFREERDAVIEAGMDDFVRKPYRSQEVFDCIERQLGLSFEYDVSTPATAAPSDLRPQDLAGLPQDLRAELLEALVSLDVARIDRALKRVSEHDPELGSTLNTHAQGLGFTTILHALKAEVE